MKRLAGRPPDPMTSPTPRKSALLLFSIAALLASSAMAVRGQSPAQPINLSTRMFVQTDENVGIGGFIICGSEPKHVVLRALGPSLKNFNKVLADPVLELRDSFGNLRRSNDNWKNDATQRAAIEASGLAPKNDLESAIDVTLDPGAYTAIVRGKSSGTGIGLVEVYDLDQAAASKLANISTRAIVGTDENIVIAGFVLGGDGKAGDTVAVRGIGPSLGVANALADPRLEIRDKDGSLRESNNDWQEHPQATQLRDTGLAPSDTHESGIVVTLEPGAYTALLSGFNDATGVGLVEVYDMGTTVPPVAVTVTRVQTGTSGTIEKQHVFFSTTSRCTETFTISVYKPSMINHSNIGSRAALQGETGPIPFSASAEDIEAALLAIPRYYAYGQFGDLELNEGSFDYFASVGAINREPVVKLDVEGGTAAEGFTIEFGSLVGSQTRYNTWVAGMPLITIEIQ